MRYTLHQFSQGRLLLAIVLVLISVAMHGGPVVAQTPEAIGSGPGFETPWGIAVEANGSLVVVDFDKKAVFRVDPVSGDRTIVSDARNGSGTDFEIPFDIAVEADGGLVVAGGYQLSGQFKQAVFRVDPITGDRTIVSDTNIGRGPNFIRSKGIVVEADGNLVVIDGGGVREDLDALVRVVPVNGDRAKLSGADIGGGPDFGSGPAFRVIKSVAVEADGNLVVIDGGTHAVVRVDPATGDRTIISAATIGSGPDIAFPEDIAVEANGGLLVLNSDPPAVVRVNPISGDRTIVSNASAGSGPALELPNGIAIAADGSVALVDTDLAAVIRVDPVTGDRAIISEGTDIVLSTTSRLPATGGPTNLPNIALAASLLVLCQSWING